MPISNRLLGVVVLFAIAAGACSETPGISAGPSSPHAPSSTAAGAASAKPSPTSSAAAVNRLTSRCSENSPCTLAAGTWTTSGTNAFIPGLSMTIPDGWSSHESNAGELKLIPADEPDDAVFLWKDVGAVDSRTENPKDLSDVPRTPEGLTASFRKNPDFVVSTPTRTTIGGNIPALTYTLGVSPSAAYESRGCPSYPTCANILRDPDHWPDDVYAIGAPELVRLYLASVGPANDRHTLVISLDATGPAELERLTKVVAPIIASLELPPVIAKD